MGNYSDLFVFAESIRDVLHKNTSLLDFASNVSGSRIELR